LEWREGGKRVRLSVGKDAADANARRLRKEAELNAVNNGVAVVAENGNNGHGPSLQPSPNSVYNKFENVMTFLKAQGIRGLVGKNDWPRYTEEEPEIYEQEELHKLFAACDADERLWFEFFRVLPRVN
jgi:hypothetical protein